MHNNTRNSEKTRQITFHQSKHTNYDDDRGQKLLEKIRVYRGEHLSVLVSMGFKEEEEAAWAFANY